MQAIDDRDEDLQALETNLDGEVASDIQSPQNINSATQAMQATDASALNLSTASSGMVNPEKASPN